MNDATTWRRRGAAALRVIVVSLACAAAFTTGGCSDEPLNPAPHAQGAGGGGGSGGSGQGGSLLDGDCDPMVPSQCGFPFPSNVWLADDPSTKTGKHVAFGPTTLPIFAKKQLDPKLWNTRDGFSPGQAPMTDLPGATTEGLPTQDTIELSVTDGSPTILLDAESGELVPHFAELDVSETSADDDRAIMIRPVVRPKDGTRYIVAMRHVVDAKGDPIPPSPTFLALRDGTASDEVSVGRRRDLYDDIFAKLEKAGIARDDLQIAWDYTTSSREANTSWLLHMRDDALATVGEDGPTYVIDMVEENPNEFIRRRITGRMTVPIYLDVPGPGGHLVFGDDGLPKQNGTAEYEFLVHIPNSAAAGTQGALIQNGHGLLGSKTEGQNGYLAELADQKHYVAFGVDLIGFAEEDYNTVIGAITKDIGKFEDVVERQHQGLLNSLLAMRMMKGRFWKDPQVQFDGKSAIDPTHCYYRGDSQGGIFGTTYMAITTDVTRGLLGEPGAPYNLLLNRSVDFAPFFALLKSKIKGGRNMQIALGLVQMLWDRTEPMGYLPYITDPLPDTPKHEIMLQTAIGDYQVTPLGAHIIARSVGAKNLAPVNRTVFGIPDTEGPFTGSSLVEFSFGLPDSPKTNVPPVDAGMDPHDEVRKLQAARDLTDVFLRESKTQAACVGPCDPE